jgi:hypothetical protein
MSTTDKESFAARLNGRAYQSEITRAEEAEARAAGLVVVFGASDDLIELRGAIEGEVDAYDGGEVAITRAGILSSRCDEGPDCPYFNEDRSPLVR